MRNQRCGNADCYYPALQAEARLKLTVGEPSVMFHIEHVTGVLTSNAGWRSQQSDQRRLCPDWAWTTHPLPRE